MTAAGGDGEVLFEFQRVGSYLRVTAIDAKTGVEVTVAGPATGSQELLKRTAINKLRFVQTKSADNRGASGSGRSRRRAHRARTRSWARAQPRPSICQSRKSRLWPRDQGRIRAAGRGRDRDRPPPRTAPPAS